MCCRFFVSHDNAMKDIYAQANRKYEKYAGKTMATEGEMLPSSAVAAFAASRSGELAVFPMVWGYSFPESKNLVINARSETAKDKYLFRESWNTRRCIIPASYYFEWQHVDDKAKQKYAIRQKEEGICYLAGLYRFEEDTRIPRCVILTKEPTPDISFIHDRMPVLFNEEGRNAWLRRDSDPEKVLNLSLCSLEYYAVNKSI